MTNKWKLFVPEHQEKENTGYLAKELDINPVLALLLVRRGILNKEQAENFFYPKLEDLHDPFLINDMDKATERLNKALQNKEKIMIYGDYDVDGTTAVSLVYNFLHRYYNELIYYIPDRYNEGYGISCKGIDYAVKENCKLIIALDCGIKAIKMVDYAKSRGIDFIICDHHVPDKELPSAVAVLDPKREDSSYPYNQLSGCGVGFKFMQGFAKKYNLEKYNEDRENKTYSHFIYSLMDLVAISIASDIVPITGENRILAYYGLKKLNKSPNMGIKGLLSTCNLKNKDITISDIVFKIGPRLNAAGRIESGNEAVELLITKDYNTAIKKITDINEYNVTRKNLDQKITVEANEILKKDKNFKNKKSIVVYDGNWHKGVIGIVASRLTEEHYKPTIVLSKEGDIATGSARSVPGFDIYKAIEHCRDLLLSFGGHTYAAGLSIKIENIPEFAERLERYVSENILPEQIESSINIDAEIRFEDIDPDFFCTLKKFNPFGPGNEKPVFCTKSVKDYNNESKLVGRNLEHIKLEICDKSINKKVDCIAFGMSKYGKYIKSQKNFDLAYTIEENTYNGNCRMQLLVKDIKTY